MPIKVRIIVASIRQDLHGFKAVCELHPAITCQEGDQISIQCDP